VRDEVATMPDLRARELWAVVPLVALIIALGVYPKPAIDVINPAVHKTLVQSHSTDPAPPHPAKAQNGSKP
jgi:NADH-quinone oxidoreductase subunit M